MESQLLRGEEKQQPQFVSKEVDGEEEEEEEVEGSGREREKAACSPVVLQALCQEPAFTLGTKETLSFLW